MDINTNFSGEEFSRLLQEAEKGDAAAQCEVGIAYRNGWGVRKNMKKAFSWLNKSAEKGCAKAQCFIGNMYAFGDYVEENRVVAIKWHKRAFKNGYKSAAASLSNLYRRMADELSVEIDFLVENMLQYKEISLLWLVRGLEAGDEESKDALEEAWQDYLSDEEEDDEAASGEGDDGDD